MLRRARNKAKSKVTAAKDMVTGGADSLSLQPDAMPAQEALAMVPLFAQMADRELASLASSSIEVSFSQGEEIVAEGDEADAMYVLLGGTAAVLKGGEEVMVYETPGEWAHAMYPGRAG
jgi:hypothetical protein